MWTTEYENANRILDVVDNNSRYDCEIALDCMKFVVLLQQMRMSISNSRAHSPAGISTSIEWTFDNFLLLESKVNESDMH